MQEDHIKVVLGLPGMRIVRQEEGLGGEVRVVVMRTTDRETCPRCGRVSTKRHDARERLKLDESLGERRRLTRRVRERMGRACRHQTGQQIAAEYRVSPTTVRRALAEVVATQEARDHPPLRVLGIAEFSIRKGHRSATGFHDLQKRRVIDVIVGRTQKKKVEEALERLDDPDQIQIVSIDMAGHFRAAIHAVLPQATIVVDKFHVIKRVTEAVRQVWRRLVRGTGPHDPLRTDGKLVLWGREHLTADQRVLLDRLLWHSPLLRCAYLLKEDFRRWYRRAAVKDARLELLAWRRAFGYRNVDNLRRYLLLAPYLSPAKAETRKNFVH